MVSNSETEGVGVRIVASWWGNSCCWIKQAAPPPMDRIDHIDHIDGMDGCRIYIDAHLLISTAFNPIAVAGASITLQITVRPPLVRTSVQKNAVSCTISSGSDAAPDAGKTHKKPNKHGNIRMVGEAGIEPASLFRERILSPSCMPIPPLAHIVSISSETPVLQGVYACVWAYRFPCFLYAYIAKSWRLM